MFKMRFATEFDPYLPKTNIPAFERVKKRGDNPGYNYEFIDFHSSNINGVPLHFEGWTTITPRYNVTLYCDVCELPVQTVKIHGSIREVHVDKFLEIQGNEKAKRELERGDRASIANLSHTITLEAVYKLQCSRCGRWVAKGNDHRICLDESYGICRYCANTMREILKGK